MPDWRKARGRFKPTMPSAIRAARPAVGLRYIALALLHYLRPMGRMRLGGSAGLKGNGMVFRADIMRDP